ncbi:hypothetical protein FRC02_006343 [Tulasnella sp. 418]|nr:hypothetical protein FRC02_006343 [Tulasnella sp. 418]
MTFSQQTRSSSKTHPHKSTNYATSIRRNSKPEVTFDAEGNPVPRLNSRERRRIRRAEEQRLKREAEALAALQGSATAEGSHAPVQDILCTTVGSTLNAYEATAHLSCNDEPAPSKLSAAAVPFTPSLSKDPSPHSFKLSMPSMQQKIQAGKRHSFSIPSSSMGREPYLNDLPISEQPYVHGHRHSFSSPGPFTTRFGEVSAETWKQRYCGSGSLAGGSVGGSWVTGINCQSPSDDAEDYNDFLKRYSYDGFENFSGVDRVPSTTPRSSPARSTEKRSLVAPSAMPIEVTRVLFDVQEGGFPSIFSVPRAIDFSGMMLKPSKPQPIRYGRCMFRPSVDFSFSLKEDPEVDHLADLNYLMDVRRLRKRLGEGVFRRRSEEFAINMAEHPPQVSPEFCMAELSPASTFSSLHSDMAMESGFKPLSCF